MVEGGMRMAIRSYIRPANVGDGTAETWGADGRH